MSDYTDLRARGILDGGKSWSIWVIGPDGLIYIFDSGVGCESMCGESLPCAVCGPALREARRECMRRVRKAAQTKRGALEVAVSKRPEEQHK